jgi:hypothetical protein
MLSYCWDNFETTASMVCNGLVVPITPTLYEALIILRTHDFGPGFLWVDQICINKSDAEENAVPVQHMLQIYKLATSTVAWLGDPPKYLHDVIVAMKCDVEKKL